MATKLSTDLFSRGDLEEYWPQRLLHIGTMTSVKRQGRDTYPAGPLGCSLVKRPGYSALSYTWGRGEDRSANLNKKCLPVKGIEWTIPAIKESFFTIENFRRVLEVMQDENEFAWVDVACIHQTDKDIKVFEMGQQVKIYQRASSIFIWLNQTSSQDLQRIMDKINALQRPISVSQIDHLMHVIDEARLAFEDISKDLWFSSIWTVQESYCTSGRSKFVSKDASYVIPNMLEDFHEFRTETQELRNDPIFAGKWRNFLDRIHEFGYVENTPDNPNIVRAVTALRHASVEQDRVLAIMSLFEIVSRPGAINPYACSLEELEHSFAAELNRSNPTLAQWFVHTNKPPTKSSWKATVNSRIPSRLGKRPAHYDLTLFSGNATDSMSMCTISADQDGQAIFEGHMCPLDALFDPGNGGILIELDDWIQSVYPDLEYGQGPHDLSFHLNFAQKLVRVLGKGNVSVLALGKNQFVYGGLLLLKLGNDEFTFRRIGIMEYEPYGLRCDQLEGSKVRGEIS